MLALTILGNNSALPAYGRHPTAQLLQTQDSSYLIDCGEGTQMQISRYKIKSSRIQHIFISHLHGDHYFGLIGLLTSMGLGGRSSEMHLYAPPILEKIIQLQLDAASAILPFQIFFHPLLTEGQVANDGKVSVECFKVYHRIDCWGFIFREIKKPRTILPDKVKAYEIPLSYYELLQKGEDYINAKGTIISNEDLTAAAPAGKSYAYCTDTLYNESIAEKVKGVDLLYHEATYLKDLHERALLRFHCTTIQAASIAKLASVKKLLIGHFSSKYEILDEFLRETSEVFEQTELAHEGVCFKI